jgi:L-2-hydroxyglutarate oxidase
MYDVAIIGGGIVGLATALAVTERYPTARLVQFEKEPVWAAHQTGHNSGVLHSGLYYRPGSQKAEMCRRGNQSMVRFCERHGVAYETCGKLVVATSAGEVPALAELAVRGRANGVAVREVRGGEVAELEPHVSAVAGLHVPSTGIVDFRAVCETMARILGERGADLHLATKVLAVHGRPGLPGRSIETNAGTVDADVVVNCAGLHSDRVARAAGADPEARIVPFRGEYFELVPGRRHLVRNLIYPVPNPVFPFLGVHFTRMLDGSVHAGPNAVPALAREGYRKRDVSVRDTAETLFFPGFWRLARRHADEGIKEIWRSLHKAAFVRSLQRLVPEIGAEDLVPAPAGVRAQALSPSGLLVDDFLVVDTPGAIHVCNAPSPAATSSLEIGRAIAERIPPPHGRAHVAFGA